MPEIESLGPAAAVVVVVFLFLKYLANQRKSDVERDSQHIERLKAITDDFRDDSKSRKDEMIRCVDRTTDVVSKNTEVLGETSVVLAQTTDILRRINDKDER